LRYFVAVVNAAVQIRSPLTKQDAGAQGVDITRHNQMLFEEIAALERAARLYQVLGRLGPLEVFRDNHQRFLRDDHRSQGFAAAAANRDTLEAIGGRRISSTPRCARRGRIRPR